MNRPATVRTAPDPRSRVLLILGSVFAGVGTLIVVIFAWVGGPVWDDLILDVRGVSVDAVVIEAHETRVGTGDRQFRYEATVEYRIGNRAPLRTTVRTRGFIANGANLQLEVDPENPRRFRRRGGWASFFGALALIPAVAAVIGFGLLGVSLLLGRSRRLS